MVFVFNNDTKETLLAENARIAATMLSRMVGLLNRSNLASGEGLFLDKCNSIHMIGMKFAIDALFLDKKGIVVGMLENFPPGKISKVFFQAKSCLELPAGTIAITRTALGDKVSHKEV